MKRLAILALLTLAAFAQSPNPKTVYVLAMSGGLDQYLAEWLAREHVMQVVTDPKLADAVLTDTLGDAFEQKMSSIHPKEGADKDTESTVHPGFRSTSSRGTIFLVDTKTREVLWSDFQKAPRTRSPGSLNKEAEQLTKKLLRNFTRH